MSQPIRAVAYFRMSSNMQDQSIPQQKSWAEAQVRLEGLHLVASLQDEGISGDKTALRDGFHEMLAFCQQQAKAGQPIEAIVCYSASRFSRADSHETAAYIWQFRQAGTNRILTAARWFDWRNEADRMLFNLQQDMTEHRYLRDLSRNITRGKLEHAKAGKFAGGSIPYGFERLVIDEHGQPVRRVARGEKLARPRNWDVALVVSENTLEVETVRWLFNEYAGKDVGLRTLAGLLNERGIPQPAKPYPRRKNVRVDGWTTNTIRRIFENAHYCGDTEWGKGPSGRYHCIIDGKVTETAGLGRGPVDRKPSGVHRDDHEAIVSRELWERVQAKLQERRKDRRCTRANGFMLSGLIRCAHCGGRMCGKSQKAVIKGRTYAYRYYSCHTAHDHHGSCRRHSIREDKLLRVLVRKLQEEYLVPERLEALRQEIARELRARRKKAPEGADRLRERIAQLEQDITTGRRRALLVKDDASFVEYNRQLSEWAEKKERLERELSALEKARAEPVEDLDRRIDAAVARLHDLKGRLVKAKPEQLREVLREMIVGIDCYFEEGERKRKAWFRLRKGVVKLRPQLEFVSSATAVP